MRRVVVTQKFFDAASTAYLEAIGCSVHVSNLSAGRADGDFSHEELVDILQDADGWIVGHARVTRELLAALPRLRIVARRGVGYERVDLEAAVDLGRVVTIASGGNDASVADQVIGMMVGIGRRFREAQQKMLGGDWSILMGTDLYRKTVGIVGLGRIGLSVVKRLKGFEAHILVVTPHPDHSIGQQLGIRFVELPELLTASDYITLHAPLNAATRHLLDAEALASMKPGAVVINTARGGLVSDRALLDALRAGHIGGAGLDVFESESEPAMRDVTNALIALPNVMAAPHAGASTREGLDRTNMIAARCVGAVLNDADPPAGCIVADGRAKNGARQ